MAFWDIRHILNKIFDATNSRVNVGVTSSIPAGTNNIGDVDVLSIAAGDNNIGNVDLASAIPAGTNNIGDVDILTIAAGDNNIGNVDIASAIPAGTNEIGGVNVTKLGGAAVAQVNTGQQVVTLKSSTGSEPTMQGYDADGQGSTEVRLRVNADMRAYNNSTVDRWRNNTAQTALASAQRTATTNSADLTLYNEPGADFIINISSINAGTPSITVLIQVKDNISSNYVTVLTSAALSTVATTRLRVYPGITAAANVAVSDILRRTIRVSVTHTDAQAIDYSISMGPIAA